ncbi:endolytic transglycosylase MltG [Shewanella aestuarii]|uniref:Endolytic murein transglycosylase n=1 Tax=Shewanella aestuarii TaxID=1028752 RepID=A0A6G9QKZ6_9GAMM|nr:endolytic transglycosylase MltG [Shewanella aestuarii]QIR14727.1 endolytic transglycosylase MltG [Shewanella aestuarii]
MNTIKTRIFASLIPVFTIICLGGYWFAKDFIDYKKQPLSITQATTLNVAPGTSVLKLTQQLEDQQMLTDSWKTRFLVKLEPQLGQIKTGLYQVLPGDTLADFLNRVRLGQEIVFSVTLIEGKTIKEWLPVLQNLPHMTFDEDVFIKVLEANGDNSGLPEGKFFPETYHYHAGENLASLLQRSYSMMQTHLAQAWQQRDPDLKLTTPYELLIIASIIEKETAKADERDWVSAVFNNRLKKGMRLQTDPTIIYGMGDRYKGNITRKDIREKTAFNTYQINGLPPTPIAAPSKASLYAAANPAKVDYIYFVSRNDGSHVFSTTLQEHNRAVNEYQRKRK